MKKLLLLSAVLYSLCSTAQNVNIPDANFKSILVGNTSINTNLDTEIQVTEAAAFTGGINANNLSIADLTGIEALTALTVLYCGYNSLTSLDVSSNTALTDLSCYNNSLTSLDVSANTALTDLYCAYNSLTSLDVSANTALIDLSCYNNSLTSLAVSANTALTDLYCYNNSLTSLDVSANTALTQLNCNDNSLTSLDVSANVALTGLLCSANPLTSLDVSANTALTQLHCNGNSLTSLDVSANTALTHLLCWSNPLTSLDVSANSALTHLHCSYNSLTSLDLQNGNNTNMDLYADVNPALSCIEVDDVTWATANWSDDVDVTASFSQDCTIGINDFNNSFLIVYPNPATNTLTIEYPTATGIYQLQDVTGKVMLSGSVIATRFNLDISALSKGVYFLSLIEGLSAGRQGEQVAHKKIIKE